MVHILITGREKERKDGAETGLGRWGGVWKVAAVKRKGVRGGGGAEGWGWAEQIEELSTSHGGAVLSVTAPLSGTRVS